MQLLSNNFEAFGLDIGDRSLKAVFIKPNGATPSLVSFGSIAVPNDACVRGEIKNPAVLAATIKKLVAGVRGKKINTVYVHACLPETHTFVKLLTVASAEEGELPAKIREELPNHFPVNPDELYIDWKIVDQDKNNNYRVVVGAVPRPIADSYTATLLAAGLSPVSLQIEADAILRSLLPQHDLPKTPIAVIDIGGSRSSFICYDQGSIQYTVSLNFSGDGLTKIIQDHLHVSFTEAEKAKVVCGLDKTMGEGVVGEIISPAVDELTAAIQKNIAYYNEHFTHASPVTSVIICGGGAHLKNLKETLEQKLGGVHVYIANPLINLVKNLKNIVAKKNTAETLNFLNPDIKFEKVKIVEPLPPAIAITYATAIGLALSNTL